MKKLICILCVMILFCCGGNADAAGLRFARNSLTPVQYSAAADKSGLDSSSDKNGRVQLLKNKLLQKQQQKLERQQLRQQLKLQLQSVRQNRKQVQVFKKTMNDRNREIQKELVTLRQKNGSVSKDKLLMIKSKLQTIKEDRNQITMIDADINEQLKQLKTCSRTQDLQGVQAALENLVSMQMKQQAVFEKAVSDLDELHNALL